MATINFQDLITNVHELDGALMRRAASGVNVGLNAWNWLIGVLLVEYQQNGRDRAGYGAKLLAINELQAGASLPRVFIRGYLGQLNTYVNNFRRYEMAAGDRSASLHARGRCIRRIRVGWLG